MNGSRDVVIVGGGAIGGSIACFLLSDPAFGGTVTVVERDPTYALASSARSAASIRQQFSTPENIRMSQFSIGWLRDAGRLLAVDGDPGGAVDLGLARGRLPLPGDRWLGGGAPRRTTPSSAPRVPTSPCSTPDELAARFPWLAVDDLALGSLGLSGEGWFDGYALMAGFRRKARSLGADYLTGEAVGLRVVGRTRRGRRAGRRVDRARAGRSSTRPARGRAGWRRSPASTCRSRRAVGASSPSRAGSRCPTARW